MFCPNCGTQNEDGRQFCMYCGTQFNTQQAAPAAQSEPVYNPNQRYSSTAPYPETSYQPHATSMPAKGIGIASMAMAIVGAVCTFGFYTIPISIILEFVAFIMGCIAKSKAKKAGMKNGFATAGFTISLIFLLLIILIVVAVILIVLILVGTASSSPSYSYY